MTFRLSGLVVTSTLDRSLEPKVHTARGIFRQQGAVLTVFHDLKLSQMETPEMKVNIDEYGFLILEDYS